MVSAAPARVEPEAAATSMNFVGCVPGTSNWSTKRNLPVTLAVKVKVIFLDLPVRCPAALSAALAAASAVSSGVPRTQYAELCVPGGHTQSCEPGRQEACLAATCLLATEAAGDAAATIAAAISAMRKYF